MTIGTPRIHHAVTGSTNDDARELAQAGAAHGTLVTAAEQTAGRGRHGRAWLAPAGDALLMSIVLRDAPPLVPLRIAVATALALGEDAQIKWPNDILIDGRKVAGILCETRPDVDWTIAGVGINVAVSEEDATGLAPGAGTLGRARDAIEQVLGELLMQVDRILVVPADELLGSYAARDALRGQPVTWNDGEGVASGLDDEGRLLVDTGTETVALNAGEVTLAPHP